MIAVPKKPKRKVRQVERDDVVKPILFALNSMPGVWACQNKDIKRAVPGKGWISLGPNCGVGSADIVFTVSITNHGPGPGVAARIGWLECKTAAKRTTTFDHAARDAHQASWAETMRSRGHFVAHGVTSVEEALAAMERCWKGYDR